MCHRRTSKKAVDLNLRLSLFPNADFGQSAALTTPVRIYLIICLSPYKTVTQVVRQKKSIQGNCYSGPGKQEYGSI